MIKIPKQERTRYFQLGVQSRITELEAELTQLRRYLNGNAPAVTVARSRKKPVRKSLTAATRRAISERMRKYWASRSKAERVRHGKLMQAGKS